ncbi:hypothetical protein B447_15501 [Thauera sp. 27]|uniref:DUF4400 domain-containing protein n=1 Tax=Thauera sp. 27 TaxID=305700 RepID=UPI0002D00F97|nr:DUF4400 domain-containing protein [Thauera sp. 27]ENO77578.1 hypothetical protein B447_15501 [Thauera sp. 27]
MFFKHVFLWVAICFALMLAIPIVSSPQAMWENARTELGLIESAFGTSDTVGLARSATETYNALFIDTGLIQKTRGAYVTREEQELGEAMVGGASRAVTGLTNNYLDTFAALTYVMILRVMIFVSWLPFILPFLLAAVGEGVTRRKIKFVTFGQYGAALYAGAMHMSVLIMMLPVLYLMAPMPMTPFFIPFWALIAAIPIIISIANASQILPR